MPNNDSNNQNPAGWYSLQDLLDFMRMNPTPASNTPTVQWVQRLYSTRFREWTIPTSSSDERRTSVPLFSNEQLNEYRQYLIGRGIDATRFKFVCPNTSYDRWLRIYTDSSEPHHNMITMYFNRGMQRVEVYLNSALVKNLIANPDRDIVLDVLDALTPSIPRGQVKVIYRDDFWGWAARRSTSPNAIRVGDKYYWRDFLTSYMDAEGCIQVIPHDQGLPQPRNQFVHHYVETDNRISCPYVHRSQLVRLEDWRGRDRSTCLLRDLDTDTYIDTGNTDGNGLRVYRSSPESYRGDFHSYSTRIETVLPPENLFCKAKNDLYAKSENTPFLGFELESVFSGGTFRGAALAHKTLDNRVISKSDGSLPTNGIEIVSAPGTLDFWKEMKLEAKLEALREQGFRSHSYSQCGFHIHVSRNALSVLDLFKIETFIHNPANKDFLVLVAGRSENSYSRFTATRFNDRKKLKDTSPRPRNPYNDDDELEGYFGVHCRRFGRYDNSNNRSAFQEAMASLILDYRAGTISRYVFGVRLNDYFTWSQCDRYIAAGLASTLDMWNARLCRSSCTSEQVEEFIRLITPHCGDAFNRVAPPSLPVVESVDELKCTSFKAKYPTSRSESNFVAGRSELSVGKTDLGRYDALNCANNNTVEFRMFKGTMCGQRVMSYLEFVEALVRFVQQVGTKEASSPEHFMRWLNSPFNRARYHNLCSYLIQKYPSFFALRNPSKFNEENA